MIRSFLALLIFAVSIRAQQSPQIVTTYAELAARTPTSRIVMMGATNGSIVFAYFADATDATNASTTQPIIKPNSYAGRWFGMKIGSGSGGGALLASNNLSDVADTNTSRINLGAAAQSDLTTVSNSVVANTASLATKLAIASNLSDLASASTARDNINGGAETAYSSAWNGQSQFASRNAVYDKIEALQVANIQALRDLDATTLAHKYVWVGGYYSRGDGGGGMFEWVSGSSNSTNRGTCFQATAGGTGRWLKYNFLVGSFSVKEFGAKGDGSTDDTAAITDTAAQAGTSGEINFPPGTYMVTSLSFSKSNYKMTGKGIIKISASTSIGVVLTGNNVVWDGPSLDLNTAAYQGISLTGTEIKIKNGRVFNALASSTNDPGGTAISALIAVRKGSAKVEIDSMSLTNSTHVDNGGARLSTGVLITDVTYATSADRIQGVTITKCHFDNIANSSTISTGMEGNAIHQETQAGYSAGVSVSQCFFGTSGRRSAKIIGDGANFSNNRVENLDTNAYSGFSSYGLSNVFNGNTIIGNIGSGIEFGSYGRAAGGGGASGNFVSFTTPYSLTNGVGMDIVARAYNVQVGNNVVVGGRMHTRIFGDVKNAQTGLTLATNQSHSAVYVTTDGTNAPSNVSIGPIHGAAPSALYLAYLDAGTNIHLATVRGTASTSTLVNRVAGVTGNNIVEVDGTDTPANNEVLMWNAASGIALWQTNFVQAANIDTSAELRALVTDESGTGALIFAGGDIGAATATTAAADDNTTKVATTAYVQTEIAANLSDTAYDATSWNGVTGVAPTKNAVRDEIEIILSAITAAVSDTAYNAGTWDGVTTIAPSKNAVRDQMELKANLISPSFTTPALGAATGTSLVLSGDATVATEVYDATGWNGDNTVPTKDAVRDKIESLVAGGGLGTADIDTSAELRGIVTDESGTGALLFAGGDIGAATGTSLALSGAATASSFTGTGTTSDSRVDVPDDDASAYAGFQANDTTTTSVNMVFPAAPFNGLAKFTVSATTNWTASQAVSSTDYAPATSGSSILYGNGSGGFSSVTVGSGLAFAGGTLSASGGSGGNWTALGTTNSQLAGNSYQNDSYSTNGFHSQATGEGFLTLTNSAGTFTYTLKPHGTMSANVTKLGPAAGYTGLTKQSNSGGTMTESQAAAGTDYYAPGSTDVAITDGGTGASTAYGGLDALHQTAETTVASATTTDLGAVASQKVSITGTTTITGFGTVAAGTLRSGRFTGILTLTHNATSLILPGGRSITTAAGDRFWAYSLGSGNWVVMDYEKANGHSASVIVSDQTYDPGNLTNGSSEVTTFTVTGTAAGDTVIVGHPSITAPTTTTGWLFVGYATATDTVVVKLTNNTGGTVNLATGTIKIRVFK